MSWCMGNDTAAAHVNFDWAILDKSVFLGSITLSEGACQFSEILPKVRFW